MPGTAIEAWKAVLQDPGLNHLKGGAMPGTTPATSCSLRRSSLNHLKGGAMPGTAEFLIEAAAIFGVSTTSREVPCPGRGRKDYRRWPP